MFSTVRNTQVYAIPISQKKGSYFGE